jgi:uncharacterized repeat protein (TIGR01451 family)
MDSESVSIDIMPAVQIDKQVLVDGDWQDTVITIEGVDLTFKIIVSNIGDVTLNDVVLTDNLPLFLTYNYDAIPIHTTASDHQITWNLGTLDVNDDVTIIYSANVDSEGQDQNSGIVTSESYGIQVSDQDDLTVIACPCVNETWVNSSWHSQEDVDLYNPNLIFNYNAHNTIQKAIDYTCECGTVHVHQGLYIEQILINKNVALLGEEGAIIILPNNVESYTIDGSLDSWIPIIFAYAGNMINNDVSGPGNIAVKIDGFEFDGRDVATSVAILYHNIETGCVENNISNNIIDKVDIGIKIDGCTQDTTIVYNKIIWDKYTFGKIGILITESLGCEPENVVINYNHLGIDCGVNIGVLNEVSIIVDARWNWWGADDGPSSPPNGDVYDAITGRIANGYGDKVVGLVNFDPWWGVDAEGTVTPTETFIGELIYFDASDSFAYDENGEIDEQDVEYMWNFGDGKYSYSKQCTHIYNSPGIYNVILRIKVINYDIEDVYGFLFDFLYFTITISEPGFPLTANANSNNLGDYRGTVNDPVKFFGAAIGGTPPYEFKWDFGDGTYSNIQNPSHTFTEQNQYNVLLEVTDSIGDDAYDTTNAMITYDDLIANPGESYSGLVEDSIQFIGSAIGGLSPYIFIWDFGDGSPCIQSQYPRYSYQIEGIYNAKLTVIDSAGSKDEASVKVSIFEDTESIPKIENIRGGFGLKATIQSGNIPVDWSISIDGLVFFGGNANGNIPAYGSQTVKIPLSLGLGKINIIINANNVEMNYNAFMLGPFIINIKEI